ncbi:MAG TPA: efflux RND transporter periplasmic adaptor subunit [Thermoanaerobaculia bacterium]|nr:efflux RND transporter periplasmic adaptor subunit [Thermoanaerobaculia bacterium]
MIPSLSAMDKPVEKPKGVSKTTIAIGAAGIVILVSAAFAIPAARRWSRAERSVAAHEIRVGTVARGELLRDASAQGKVVAALHPTLFSPSQGIVTLLVKAGAEVKKGQPLARIESPELSSKLAQERAGLQSMESSLERQKITARQQALKNAQNVDLLEVKLQAATRLLERAQRTFDEGLLNKTDYEKAKDDLKVAQLELANAKTSSKLDEETAAFDIRDRELQVTRQASISTELTRQLGQTNIAAPFDGLVASVGVQDRDAVAASQPILTVVNLEKYEVEITLPENYAADVAPGTAALIAYEGREYPGKVTAISPEIRDSQIKGTVVFDGTSPQNLRQSQRVSVRMVFEKKPDVLKLPRGPFLESGAGRSAYVLANGVATKRDIEVGAVSVSEVEVVKGLSEGDKVIVSDTSEWNGAKTVLVR